MNLLTPQERPLPDPEDHPRAITARYYEALLGFMRDQGHKTRINDRYFQMRYFVTCDHAGCHASLSVIQHDGNLYHFGKGPEVRCPMTTWDDNNGTPMSLAELQARQWEAARRTMAWLEERLGR